MFARPEACLFYFYVKFDVVGVIYFFLSVDLVGEDSAIAAIIAGWQHNERVIVKLKDDIGRPPKVKRITVKPKIDVDMA